MLRLFQKSSVLGTSARLAAPSSTIASKHERNMSTKKGVVINLGGCIVPAMSPVLSKYAREHSITESDLVTKLFKEGDQGEQYLFCSFHTDGAISMIVHYLRVAFTQIKENKKNAIFVNLHFESLLLHNFK